MITITLNNLSFEIRSFSRHTQYTLDTIDSHGQFEIIDGVAELPKIKSLINVPIISLIIKKDNEIIYDMGTITANIECVDELLNGEAIDIDVHLQFLYKLNV